MTERFYQTERIVFPLGTQARTYRNEIILDSSYERCVGIAVIESQTGGIPTYRLGLEDKDKMIISSVHKSFLQSDPAAGLKLDNRVLPLNIKAGGHKVKVITDIPVQLVSEMEYDVIFLLERNEQAT